MSDYDGENENWWEGDYAETTVNDETEHHPGMGCDLGERHTGVCVVNGKVL